MTESIQVNHWKKRSLQYRVLVKLKHTEANYSMMMRLRQALGFMTVHVRNHQVLLIENDQGRLKRFISLIQRHGLILDHRRKQYVFFHYCFTQRVNYSEYAKIKQYGDHWKGFESCQHLCPDISKPQFESWLCGFTEAEGCFCIRTNGTLSFSLSQKNGQQVLNAGKSLFWHSQRNSRHQNGQRSRNLQNQHFNTCGGLL